ERAVRPLQCLFQAQAIEPLHGQEGDASILSHLVYGNDVFMSECGRQAGLAQKALTSIEIRSQFRTQDLDRGGSMQMAVFRAEHDAHSTSANDLEKTVLTEPANFRFVSWNARPCADLNGRRRQPEQPALEPTISIGICAGRRIDGFSTVAVSYELFRG